MRLWRDVGKHGSHNMVPSVCTGEAARWKASNSYEYRTLKRRLPADSKSQLRGVCGVFGERGIATSASPSDGRSRAVASEERASASAASA